ncbi:uncharacterized protein [Lolium perenne]|uniref:uncharacterized protein isoform X6 n=1 Tax=Lolium perenne TaxID=4522 RepID=UPI003A990963
MARRGARGDGFLHGEAPSKRPAFRGCRGGRRDRYRISGHQCMFRVNGHGGYTHCGDVPDYPSSNDDSHDEASSSSDDFGVIVNSRRKRFLDDALFEFFSKEAIKSLKRDFSNFCRGSDVWKENKRAKLSGVDKSCFTVYSSKYFFEVLHRLTVEQKSVIQKFGFSCLLVFAKTHIPSSFIRWLSSCVDSQSSQIIVDDKIINISKDSLHYVLGFPNSGVEVVDDSDGGADFIMSLFHHITFFGDKLRFSKTLSDQEIFVCFMQIAISCFLCPSGNDRLDTKYIKQLGDCEQARSFDICQLVYNHLILGITKTLKFIKVKGRKPNSFEFCSYALAISMIIFIVLFNFYSKFHCSFLSLFPFPLFFLPSLQVHYLDCLDFGVHTVGSGIPRAVSWSGDMIVEYSELDRKGQRSFGRRRLRTDLPGYYLNNQRTNMGNTNCMNLGTHFHSLSAQFKQSLHDKFGIVLDGKIIDGIFETVQCTNSSHCGNNNMLESLTHDVLDFLSNAWPGYKSCRTVPTDLGHLDTPVALASKHVVQDSNITAPKMHPVAKFKSRLTLHLPENRAPDLCQSDLISPIGRLSLSPSARVKEASKVQVTSAIQKLVSKPSEGSKEAPIRVGDTTPKTILKADDSPEVVISGTSTFKDRQKQLADEADAVYNKKVHAKSSHVNNTLKTGGANLQVQAEVVEVVDVDKLIPKRTPKVNGFVTLQPKNSLVFPLPENSRFPVSDDDIMHFCAIVELAYTDRVQKNYALEYHGVHCSFISLGQTLMPDGHIDNFLIPCFCRKLFEDNHPSKSGRHYFFSYIGESILELSNPMHENMVRTSFLGAASASKGKRLDFSDRA